MFLSFCFLFVYPGNPIKVKRPLSHANMHGAVISFSQSLSLIEQLQASVKSQDAVIDQLRNSGAGQGSGDQPANDADRQLSSLIDLQVKSVSILQCV